MELNAAAGPSGEVRPGGVAMREHLAFRLGTQEYAIDLLKVQEIRSYEQPTRIANLPPFVRGVVNLRGAHVPIVDLRLRFGLGRRECDNCGAVIVANLGGRLIGLVVDSVSGVLEMPPDAVHETAGMLGVLDTECITGLGTLGDRKVILVDVEPMIMALHMASAG
jgi:purine-binding chemotaxis protein CheW